MFSATRFEPRGFILRDTVVYGVWYVLHASVCAVWWIGESRTQSPIHQTANINERETYHTAYTTVSLRMNPRGSKRVAENIN
jgi:hypothetical protein